MMTVHEVSKLAGVSIRTLQYYDKIGLLHPTGYTDAGYRLPSFSTVTSLVTAAPIILWSVRHCFTLAFMSDDAVSLLLS